MTNIKVLTRLLLRYDIRDWSTLVFTFLFPVGLLIILVLSMKNMIAGIDLTNPISANVTVFGAAFVGIFSGASHLALWRENGMLTVLRSFPFSSNTIITAQAISGTILLSGQIITLITTALILGMQLKLTAPIALLPLLLGYLLFFMLGVLLGVTIPSMAGVSMSAIAIIIPLGMIGGTITPVDLLPEWAQTFARYTPIYHIREATSLFLIGHGTWLQTGISLLYLIAVTTILGFTAQHSIKWK